MKGDAMKSADIDTSSTPLRIEVRAGRSTLLFLAFVLGLPLAVLITANQPTIQGALTGIFIGLALVVSGWFHLRAVIEVDGGELRVRYQNQTYAERLDNLRFVSDEKMNFEEDPRRGIGASILGSKIKGFNVGWFRLRDDSVAFACLSRKRNARALESRDGYLLLLDPRVARKISGLLPARPEAALA